MSDPPPLGLITQLVPLQSIRADEGAAALKQIAGPLARIEPVARSNALLITDRGANVARYLELLRRLDERPQGESGLRTYVVPLKYANAEDLAYALGQSFEVNVAGSRGPSLADRSLSRNLDVFRGRELDTFRQRQQSAGDREHARCRPRFDRQPTRCVRARSSGARPSCPTRRRTR